MKKAEIAKFGYSEKTSKILLKCKISKEEHDRLKKEFVAHDKDKSGSICKEEMMELLKKEWRGYQTPTEEDVVSIMDEYDKNGDGSVSMEEYLFYLLSSDESANAEEAQE